METKQAQLKELEALLYHREEEVIARGERLQTQVDLQDVKAGKIYEAYVSMGLIAEAQIMGIIGQFVDKNLEWPDRESFWKKYSAVNCQLNQLLSLSVAQSYPKETICRAEKVIADLMIVLRYHWGTLADSLASICNFISICKYSEYLSIVGLERSGAAISNRLSDPTSLISVKEDLMTERMEHIQDQLGFLSREERILQEMQLICDERERLYGISRKLFLG